MSAQRNVLIVGSINVDCTVKVNVLPLAGETIHGSEPFFLPGGKGGNQAVAVAVSGGKSIMIGAVGSDQHGTAALSSLTDFGVDVSCIVTKPGATGTAFIFVEDNGENLIVVTAGANGLVVAAEVEDKFRTVAGECPVVLCQMELPIDAVMRSAELAQEYSGRFVLNLAPAELVPIELLALCDPLIVNETEAELITGKSAASIDLAKEVALELARTAKSVVVTLGADGAIFAEGGQVAHTPGQKVDVVDTTGAGDAFVGALAAALSSGQSLAEAVSSGILSGTRAVQHFGAQPPKN